AAIAEVDPDATAFVHRRPLHSMQYLAYWGALQHQAPSLAWLRAWYASMRPYVTGGAYVNYADPDLEHWQAAYYGSHHPAPLAGEEGRGPRRPVRVPPA